MSNFDEIKGKSKQAAGDLTDDADLRQEGKGDEAAGKVKDVVDTVKEKLEDGVDAVKDKLKRD